MSPKRASASPSKVPALLSLYVLGQLILSRYRRAKALIGSPPSSVRGKESLVPLHVVSATTLAPLSSTILMSSILSTQGPSRRMRGPFLRGGSFLWESAASTSSNRALDSVTGKLEPTVRTLVSSTPEIMGGLDFLKS